MHAPARGLGNREYHEAERARLAAWKVRRPSPPPTRSERGTAAPSVPRAAVALAVVIALGIVFGASAVAAGACPAAVALRTGANERPTAGVVATPPSRTSRRGLVTTQRKLRQEAAGPTPAASNVSGVPKWAALIAVIAIGAVCGAYAAAVALRRAGRATVEGPEAP